ncbi:hypothetical protein BJ912DRAFT_1096288 [Pholiota molesta]|nr:hypothetical protein BJ912DRAFT_1096288 [Pholiota molesta]
MRLRGLALHMRTIAAPVAHSTSAFSLNTHVRSSRSLHPQPTLMLYNGAPTAQTCGLLTPPSLLDDAAHRHRRYSRPYRVYCAPSIATDPLIPSHEPDCSKKNPIDISSNHTYVERRRSEEECGLDSPAVEAFTNGATASAVYNLLGISDSPPPAPSDRRKAPGIAIQDAAPQNGTAAGASGGRDAADACVQQETRDERLRRSIMIHHHRADTAGKTLKYLLPSGECSPRWGVSAPTAACVSARPSTPRPPADARTPAAARSSFGSSPRHCPGPGAGVQRERVRGMRLRVSVEDGALWARALRNGSASAERISQFLCRMGRFGCAFCARTHAKVEATPRIAIDALRHG